MIKKISFLNFVLFSLCCFGFKQIATFLAVYAKWGFANIKGIGWKWAGIIWLYSLITYIPLDILKFTIRYILMENPWNLIFARKVTFTTKREHGKEEIEAIWDPKDAVLLRSNTKSIFDKSQSKRTSQMVEQAKWRAEMAK